MTYKDFVSKTFKKLGKTNPELSNMELWALVRTKWKKYKKNNDIGITNQKKFSNNSDYNSDSDSDDTNNSNNSDNTNSDSDVDTLDSDDSDDIYRKFMANHIKKYRKKYPTMTYLKIFGKASKKWDNKQ
ncbi:hypothetical protein LBA_00166 [Megavirus lba]|uniref:Uncharacterized protein n=1 Tax=Megavirus lba TaxID=1235314 RepID=L7Y3G6_9VIRU|nr:hypothetical protein LBA_00166 [Megavirus lba]